LIKHPEVGEIVPTGDGAERAFKGRSGMIETLLERAWAWLHANFPERQIYIRSDGRVQFFTFGATLQATLAGLTLIFLMWVAFASVNVIFKDRIIAAKDHHYQQMQSAYENRVADLQYSYDELNNALVSAEDRFKATADELQTKQASISHLLSRKDAVDSTLASLGNGGVNAIVKTESDDIRTSAGASSGMAGDSVSEDGASAGLPSTAQPGTPNSIPAPNSAAGTSQLGVMPQAIEPQPRTAKPAKASFLDDTVTRFAAVLFHPKAQPLHRETNLPALRILSEQTERVAQMGSAETSLLIGVDEAIKGRIGKLQSVLRHVGVDPDALEAQAQGGIGGPDVPVESVRIEGIEDNAFTAAFVGATGHGRELETLFSALHHVPLTTPVHGAQFELTSGFGGRIDPFTRRLSFHPGVDFGGPWGSTVGATAPGVVVWAGGRGGYGNMVEIDHGYGFKTRYGHLSSILVKVGDRVEKGSPIGKLGSTGRSTGPHVHYEIWLANNLKDPSTFIEAGRHVLQ
jgi:murein DD-endopeptidase MepM/ murein hydrolase activator NlpD